MKRLSLTNFSLKFPWLILLITAVVTAFFAAQFPKVNFDNDPENMLSKDEPVRLFHHLTKERYALYDFVIVGIVNDTDTNGIFNVKTLQHVDRLTKQLLSLRKGPDGLPQVALDDAQTKWETIDLSPHSAFKRAMNVVFMHDPNRLFDKDGNSAIIADELIAPGVVDNIKQAEAGSLKLEYLMEHVPKTLAEANIIRDDAMNNPLYKGTLVAEDGKAVCVYIPIIEKPYSYNVAELVRHLTKDWDGNDKIYIAGLPVAEDTFGVEMLVQMSISAPLAMLILFLLMYFFFRRVSLILAPMLLAVITVIITMGLLIGLGYDVHIMSSMIPIFIMPITVCNSIHVLSEFFDSYGRFNDKKKTLQHVIKELFMPMLYATTTTIAGFASLATTPIPPVRIFGLHVAFGVFVGWLLTMTFVPVFISLFISEKSLQKLGHLPVSADAEHEDNGLLGRFLHWTGSFTYRRARFIVTVAVFVMAFSVYGISLINVNDNPVKWFTKNHELRVADTVLNSHFGGTYTAYLTLTSGTNSTLTCEDAVSRIRKAAVKQFEQTKPQALKSFLADVDKLRQNGACSGTNSVDSCFAALTAAAEKIDDQAGKSWNAIADTVNEMDPEGLTYATLGERLQGVQDVSPADIQLLLQKLRDKQSLTGDDLIDAALDVCDSFTGLSFRELVTDQRTEIEAPAFKQPALLRYVDRLQRYLDSMDKVGKTTSAVDALKKAQYELRFIDPQSVPEEERAAVEQRNQANFSVPESVPAVGQVYIQLEGMKKKDSLFHLVTRDFRAGNMWVQLTSGDNKDMSQVVEELSKYVADNPPPVPVKVEWAGLTYLNVVWQKKMVMGMLSSLASSWIVVLVMMLVLFRSWLFGILAMVPLTVTITFIYGLIGWFGKDYDMPVAILSAMTLGLSVDFAIHFLERGREMYKTAGNWKDANLLMFREPAKAISRNAIVIALGFLPLLLAPLVPYRTVGFFLAMIMLVSWLATLFILPALVRLWEKRLFKKSK